MQKLSLEIQELTKNQIKADEVSKMVKPFSHFAGFFVVAWKSKGKLNTVFSKSLYKTTLFFMSLKSKYPPAKLYYFPANGGKFKEVGRCI